MRIYYSSVVVIFIGAIFFFFTCSLSAQQSTAADRQLGYQQRQALEANSLLGGIEFTNIGPTVMSGRITDLAVNPADPTEFYAAYASGGLWHTTNNGLSFEPLFQDQAVMTIGAIGVHWPSRTIYLGSGEVNSSRSSYAGNGVYKSADGGNTWTHLGLEETHHIGQIQVAEEDANLVWVAALGHLYGTNPERGVFKTTDGGQSWKKTLFVNDNTGAVEVHRDSRNGKELFATTWERSRSAWDFQESGAGSGIWHSMDAGETWAKISFEKAGFPDGAGTGRIGLAIGYTNDAKRVMYASLDNYNRRPEEAPEPETLTKNQLKKMSVAEVVAQKDYVLNDYLRDNGYPRDLSAKQLRQQLKDGSLTIEQLTTYLEDANSLLFDTPVKGLEIYKSTDNGQNWVKTHDGYLESVYNSYGYYFGQVRVNPANAQQIYAMGVPIIRSDDGGKTWISINGDNVHADHHSLWINPKKPAHLINGNDGGVNISYDYGEHWFKANSPAVGQFYAVAVDNHPDGYRVYGGLQDNGVWRGPHDYEYSDGWHQDGKYPYEALLGGDGMQVEVDPRDNETLYTGYQFGNYVRYNPKTGDRAFITPKHNLSERPYRWNWQAPIHLSVHNSDILYMGSNFLHRSMNQGDDFSKISEDLTLGGRKGDVPFGTLATIHESPLRFGLIYTGSDDGLIHVTRDGGFSWANISKGLPTNLWVSRVVASAHVEGRVYASLNGYRSDDFGSYVYRSDDYGQNWTAIGTDLPAEPVNVIKEDPANAMLLYVGTDHGLYVSQDGGKRFQAVGQFPKVAVHDLVVQAEAKDLIVGTHGRSIYRADVAALQALTADANELMVFKPATIRASGRWGTERWWPRIKVEPGVDVQVFAPKAGAAKVTISLKDGPQVNSFASEVKKGLNVLNYDLTVDADRGTKLAEALNKDRKDDDERPVRFSPADNGKIYVKAGTYVIKVEVAGEVKEVELVVK